MKVQGKVIVVTGAGSGIGRELSLHLVSKGARVAGVDLNEKALDATAVLAANYKYQFRAYVANVADWAAVEALPAQILSRFGEVDGIINNAGIIQPFSRLNDLDYATIERVLNVNLYGTLFVTKAFLPHLLDRPEAHIVNLSSMGGFVPVPGQTIYCAAKAAVKLLSEGLASELSHTNVRFTIVCPGAVATNSQTIKIEGVFMNAFSPDQSTSHDAIFASLRTKLCREVRGSAMLLAFLERVNEMQAMHTEPEAFKASFDDFVARADDYMSAIRPFFPMLVGFLPSHPGVLCEPQSPECYAFGRGTSGISLAS